MVTVIEGPTPAPFAGPSDWLGEPAVVGEQGDLGAVAEAQLGEDV
ncbi:hypothetical protein [Micromonospora cremea]|nr:hypothetical protein [Micromonospora cremea]